MKTSIRALSTWHNSGLLTVDETHSIGSLKATTIWSFIHTSCSNGINTRLFVCLAGFCLFICLFVYVQLENFSLKWRRQYDRWRAANLTYSRHLWPLNSGGSLACYSHCDTGHPFIMVFSEDKWHSSLLPRVKHGSCNYLFLRLRSVAAGLNMRKWMKLDSAFTLRTRATLIHG